MRMWQGVLMLSVAKQKYDEAEKQQRHTRSSRKSRASVVERGRRVVKFPAGARGAPVLSVRESQTCQREKATRAATRAPRRNHTKMEFATVRSSSTPPTPDDYVRENIEPTLTKGKLCRAAFEPVHMARRMAPSKQAAASQT